MSPYVIRAYNSRYSILKPFLYKFYLGKSLPNISTHNFEHCQANQNNAYIPDINLGEL